MVQQIGNGQWHWRVGTESAPSSDRWSLSTTNYTMISTQPSDAPIEQALPTPPDEPSPPRHSSLGLATHTERPLRVLLLGPYPPPWGGVQTNLVALRDFLRRRGVHCAVVNLTRHRRAEQDGVHYPRSGAGVIRLLLGVRYDVIHLHIGGDLSTRLVSLGLICSALPWAKTVLTFHSGGYPGSPEGRNTGPLTFRGFALRRFDRNIAVNEELADFFRRVGCDARRVRLIPPHAVPAATLGDLMNADLPADVARFVSRHRRLVVSVSGLEPEYDIPLQLEALAVIRERYPDAGLLVIGSGSLITELRAAASEKSYGEHILLAGDLPHAVTLSAVARANVFLRTTHYDGDAISVREALWLGTPAIVTDNGMRPVGVQLVPIGDGGAVADAVIRQLARPQEARDAKSGSLPVQALGEENLESTLRLYREMLQ